MIDLRSDTVTRPTESMRHAMANAEVGDDVYGEDPTVNRLEERAAEILDREAALFVPTGTMGNQTAIHLHTIPGSEVIADAGAHVFNFEMGAMAALSGTLPRAITTADGILEPAAVAGAIQPRAGYRTPTSLLVLENSHNLAGGRVTRPDRMAELIGVARQHDLPVHLDGARIFNAAAALGIPAAELARGADTVMFCLSKGLAAPVGSMLVGDTDAIGEARRIRKMFGGGMRQAGVLAAAGLVALDEMVPRVGDDNERARSLAEALATIDGLEVDLTTVETNIFMVSLADHAPLSARELSERLHQRGVLAHALTADSLRLVIHYEITDDDVTAAADLFSQVMISVT